MAWFDGFRIIPIPQEDWLQCQLALIEGFTNAVRHAHRGLPPDTLVSIEVTVADAYLDIKIWDQGPGFDFQAMLDQKLETTTADSEGGRGLRIMYRVADIVEYQQTSERGNCLHIHKQFSPESA